MRGDGINFLRAVAQLPGLGILRRHEGDWLLVNRQDDAAGVAADAMGRAGGVDAEAAGGELSMLIGLGAGEDEDVLKTIVAMERDFPARREPQQRRGWPGQPIAVEPINLDPFLERLPRDTRFPIAGAREIESFKGMIDDGLKRGNDGQSTVSHPLTTCPVQKNHWIAAMNASDGATAPNTPPCILIILSAAWWLP